VCRDGAIQTLALEPVKAALAHDLVPVVFGDVALDEVRGGTIVSTEEVFRYLASPLRPQRIFLAGIEPGVLSHWPDGEVIPRVTPGMALAGLSGSRAADVTGGMASKVGEMLALAELAPDAYVRIFSGVTAGLVRAALLDEAQPGTAIGAAA